MQILVNSESAYMLKFHNNNIIERRKMVIKMDTIHCNKILENNIDILSDFSIIDLRKNLFYILKKY